MTGTGGWLVGALIALMRPPKFNLSVAFEGQQMSFLHFRCVTLRPTSEERIFVRHLNHVNAITGRLAAVVGVDAKDSH